MQLSACNRRKIRLRILRYVSLFAEIAVVDRETEASVANKAGIPHADTDTDTDILARILADTSDARFHFLKLFLWQAQRHADMLATILARMSARKSVLVSVSVSVSAPWNTSLFMQ